MHRYRLQKSSDIENFMFFFVAACGNITAQMDRTNLVLHFHPNEFFINYFTHSSYRWIRGSRIIKLLNDASKYQESSNALRIANFTATDNDVYFVYCLKEGRTYQSQHFILGDQFLSSNACLVDFFLDACYPC